MIPAAPKAFGFDADLVGRLGLQQVQGDTAETAVVFGGMSLPDTPVIVGKADV